MVLYCELPAYRLLFIAVGLYLSEHFVLGNHANQPSSRLSDEHVRLNDMRIKHGDSNTSGKREQIQASIIAKIGPQRHDTTNHPISSRRPEAEVRILVPVRQILPPLETDQLLRASSILMDFGEDTRQYFLQKDHAIHQDRRQHRIRHGSHRHVPSTKSPDIFHAANDAPLNEHSSTATPETLTKPSHILVKSLDYPHQRVALPRRKIDGLGKLHPLNDSIWIAFHSPEKIFIPVRYNDERSISATPAKRGCVQCSANLTLTAARGESTVEVPVPVISICARLARRRGRMNIAVSSGPRPGVRVSEGEYPVQVIAWKKGGNVYTCQYTLTVTVKKCSNVPSLEGGSVECSNGTIWGSKCHFSCFSDYVLQGQRTIECEGNSDKVAWSSAFPVCRKNPAKNALTLRKLPCMKPPLPEHGTVVCNTNDKEIYPDGSVCQFFCYPGFLIDQLSTTNVLIVCKNSRWTPSASVQCVASYCPEPKAPKDGSMRCKHPDEQDTKNVAFKSKYRNGTTCSTRCDIGYVIPTSQLSRSSIVCHAPTWNDSSIPECRRAMPPERVSGCHNVTVAVGVGQTFQVEVHRLPSFVSEKGELLTPNCELQGKKLPKGVHRNFCEATDKELRVTTVCTYYIEVEERRAPRPYLRDCKSRTLIATRRGTVKLKPPRFVVTRSRNSAKTFLHGNCTYSGDIVPGTYINLCTAHDEATNSTGSCSYSVTVKERSCQPLPVIPHASLDCDLQLNGLYSPRTTCKYVCEEGFTIPKSQRRRRIRRCTSKLIWKPIMEPSCKRVSPPHPVRDACLSQTFILKNNRTFVNLKPPKFKSSLKGSKVKVHCSLNKTLPAGNYINVCEAFDTELEISASCKYNVTVKNVECPLLDPVLRGSITCDGETDSVYRVGTLCNYECDEGYVIPTSLLPYATKLCTYLGRWNSTVSPICIPHVPPVQKEGSCLNGVVSVEDLSRFNVPQPEFVSSNGVDLEIECDPSNITNYGVHNITCIALNPQSRASSSCSFQLDVQNPNEETELDREEIGCVELGIVENGIVHCNSTESKILPFKTLCEISCDEGYVIPSSETHLTPAICEENAEWNVSNVPHCVKATGCVELGIVQNGIVHCNSTESKILPIKTLCEISCDEGYVIPASHRYLIPAICEEDAEWNVSSIPHCVKAESPILYSGCKDQVIQLTELVAVDYNLPDYNTVRGTPANMTCAPDKLTSYGLHKVSCIAKDEELGTYASCSFGVTVLKNNDEDIISTTNAPDDVTTTQITTTEKFLACKSLKLPYRGILNCSNHDGPERCTVGCENGYGFSSSYRALRGGLIECDGTDGLWDFERIYHTTQLPECLGHLPNTSIKVSLSFKAAVEECSSEREFHYHQTIKHLLLNLNREMCSLVDCESSIQVNCSQTSTGNRFILNIIWTLLAVFHPEDYEDSLEVPDAELQLEAILETTRKAIRKDEVFRQNLSQVGIQLQQDSYNRSFIDLVCQANGYAADPRTYKCMECASGTMEVNGQCKPCPQGTFQLRAGQTNCEHCPSDSVKFFRGNVPATCGG